jgi:hypothetical protein
MKCSGVGVKNLALILLNQDLISMELYRRIIMSANINPAQEHTHGGNVDREGC